MKMLVSSAIRRCLLRKARTGVNPNQPVPDPDTPRDKAQQPVHAELLSRTGVSEGLPQCRHAPRRATCLPDEHRVPRGLHVEPQFGSWKKEWLLPSFTLYKKVKRKKKRPPGLEGRM